MCALEVAPAIGTADGRGRLILRRPVKADATAIAELANDIGVAGMIARMPHPYGLADAETFLARCEALDPRTDAVFAIEHRQFGVIGMLGFRQHQPRRPELGYWLGRPFWGRGYATEAATAALDWARRDWGKAVVWAGHFADNRASAQVLVKAGFLYTGDVELQDCLARGEKVPSRKMVWLA